MARTGLLVQPSLVPELIVSLAAVGGCRPLPLTSQSASHGHRWGAVYAAGRVYLRECALGGPPTPEPGTNSTPTATPAATVDATTGRRFYLKTHGAFHRGRG